MSASEPDPVLFEVDEDSQIATVTLNRPQAANSFNQPMLDAFEEIWRECRLNDAIHAVVLRAAGDRAFSTGVDRKEGRFRHPNPWSQDDPGCSLGAKQNRVWKPVICAVHGIAAGGAFYWINESDVVICSEEAQFFDPHTSYGMTTALEPVGLLRRIPYGEVMRIALFGLDERVSAVHALRIGLVSEVVPRAELWSRAHELASRLASKPPIAIQGTVRAIWESMEMSASGCRTIPYVYPTIGNPLSQVDFTPGASPAFELR